jgi:hypothetical protein
MDLARRIGLPNPETENGRVTAQGRLSAAARGDYVTATCNGSNCTAEVIQGQGGSLYITAKYVISTDNAGASPALTDYSCHGFNSSYCYELSHTR